MNKNFFALLLSALLLLGTLVGCGGGSGENSPASKPNEPSENTSAEKVDLRYAIWNADQAPALQTIIDEFEAENKDIHVELEVVQFDQYWVKLEAGASGSSLPDVFWMNAPNFQKYASNDILMDLSGVEGIDFSNYADSLVELYTYEGKNYGVPKDYDTIGLWYNKEIFDNAGVPYPDQTWTWEKVVEAAQQLNDPANNIYGFGAPLKDQEGYYNTILAAGGYVISDDAQKSGFDLEETKAGIAFLSDFVNKYQVSPTLSQYNENPNMTMFENGMVAMQFGGSWRQASIAKNELIADKAGVTYMPIGPSGKNTCVVHGLSNAGAASTKHPAETKKFLAFLGSERAAEIQAETGTVLPAFNGAAEKWVASNEKVNLQVFVDMVESTAPFPASKDTAVWAAKVTENLTKVWQGDMSVENACNTIAIEMNAALAAEG